MTSVAVEDPGWLRGREFISRWGLTPLPVAVDADGLRVDELAGCGARAVMVTPAHQFPTGVVLDQGRRSQLIAWARENQGLVIEDDYDSEYRYDGEPVGALQGLAPDCIVYGGSLSKTLAPGIRLGWLVVPKNLVDGVVDAKYTDDRGSSTLEQLALARFIACGALDRHRRRSRLRYRETRDRLVDVFRCDAPEVRIEGIAAGLHFLARLPSGADEASLVAAGARRSVGLHALAEFASPGRAHGPALVMGYGGIPRHALGAALTALGATLADR